MHDVYSDSKNSVHSASKRIIMASGCSSLRVNGAKPHYFFHQNVVFNFTYVVHVWQNLAQHTYITLRAPLIGIVISRH